MFRIIGGDQKVYGPITVGQLRQWIAEGRANEHTMICAEGTSEWRPLSAFPDFVANPGPSTPASRLTTQPKTSTSDAVSTVIPYRNMPALISYYLAVFSLIPCLGIPLGLAAVVLGVIGLKRAREKPEAKGKFHAWTGITIGGLFGFGYLIALTLYIAGGVGRR